MLINILPLGSDDGTHTGHQLSLLPVSTNPIISIPESRTLSATCTLGEDPDGIRGHPPPPIVAVASVHGPYYKHTRILDSQCYMYFRIHCDPFGAYHHQSSPSPVSMDPNISIPEFRTLNATCTSGSTGIHRHLPPSIVTVDNVHEP